MNIEEGLKLIEQYIFEITGKRIESRPPNTEQSFMLYNLMLQQATEYFNNKNK